MGFTAVLSGLRARLWGLASTETLARAALVALAFALPFELESPLASLGPLALSSVELFLYAAVGLAALAAVVRRAGSPGRVDPFVATLRRHAAPLAWALAVTISALRAPVEPQHALKFAFRSLGGVVLYFAAAALLRTPRAVLATAIALALGAGVAALLVWAEVRVPGAAEALAPFHARTFEVLGLPRPSGPFQYPNIAAMYLEAALPVVLVLGAALDARWREANPSGRGPAAPSFRRRNRYAVLTTAGAVGLGAAVWLTASRAGVATVVLVLAALAARGFWPRRSVGEQRGARSSRRLGWQALAALGGLAVVFLLTAPAGSRLGLRMQYWRDPAWYRSSIALVESAQPVRAALGPGTTTFIELRVENQGAVVWPRSGANRVAVSYHWKDRTSAEMVVFDGVRTPLPRDLPPGAAATVNARIDAPLRPGAYLLLIDLVHEGVTWFGDQGNAGLVIELDVSPTAERAASAAFAHAAGVGEAPPDAVMPSRGMLWRAAFAAWRDHPLFGLGPDNFRLVYGGYLGVDRADDRFHANSLYFETLASLGLLGLLALAFLVLGLWRVGRRVVALPSREEPSRLLALGVVAALGAFFVHGIFDYFLEFTPTYGLVWLLAGMLVGLDNLAPEGESEIR